ncbi:biotin-dependent carboxyltransferase family protein [Alkaliphilus pronyensis]|uniref:Biotin-dependent carboxyltransferase family protein n=1 Tax=Alkaliphilus pronyensis TaxID=1482732 RepID=A0A6I0F305_9FIRM|nr:biotin-dependent carboxyltransferase family protein [Alkaliphilus pronyensis]KAB3532761.1 biotin-dependent carboxyltransferase family protein [Alkaliphilus pronyensis]
MSSIRILRAGLLTTIQDLGRVGFQQYGIPVSGAMDKYSLKLANILVGNDRGEGALEITMLGPEILFNCGTTIAITGGNLTPTINDVDIDMYRTYVVKPGDKLKFKGLKNGCRGYMAVSGGFSIKPVMGSKSTYMRGQFGGFKGRKLKEEDFIPLKKPGILLEDRKIKLNYIKNYNNRVVRVILGTELHMFKKDTIDVFLSEEYQLTNQCDRMGYRLEGPGLKHVSGSDVISGGINLGAIQVPGDGKPIIMMADRQSTGGYAKIANVISTDISLLAQMKPGDKIRFQRIAVEEAQQLLIDEEKMLDDVEKKFSSLKEKIMEKNTTRVYNIRVKGIEYRVVVEEEKVKS